MGGTSHCFHAVSDKRLSDQLNDKHLTLSTLKADAEVEKVKSSGLRFQLVNCELHWVKIIVR